MPQTVRTSRSPPTTTAPYAEFVGLTKEDGTPQRSGYPDPNLRLAVVGVFTDLTGPAPQGLSLSADIDTRFTTNPTPLKLAAIVLAILSTIIAVLALWRLDRVDGRRMHRLIPTRWKTVTAVDAFVVGVFSALVHHRHELLR